VSEKSISDAHGDASEATKAPNHSAFQPQKGVLVLQNQLPAIKFRRIRDEQGDSG
jgi:hypothetical protein